MLLSANLADFGRFFAKIADNVKDTVQKVGKETKKDSFVLDRRNGFCYDKSIKDFQSGIPPVKIGTKKTEWAVWWFLLVKYAILRISIMNAAWSAAGTQEGPGRCAQSKVGILAVSLEVTMFGGFVLRHNGKPLKLERNNVTRSMQVLQMLLFHGENGVPKDVLMDQLFGYEDGVTNPANNLKVTISNLRRILKQVGLEDTTVVFKAGSYYLISSEEITVDAFQFHQQAQLALAAQGEDRTDQMQAACDLYTGDFLPHLAGCDWAMVAAVHYKEEYAACVHALCAELRQRQDWQQMLRVSTQASGLYPQEDWDILRIQSLLAMQRYQEAKEVYEETANRMLDEFGVKPGEHLNECMRQLENMLPSSKASLEQLQDVLKEEDMARGAYYCPFPSFIDTYRTVSRMLERSGQSAYLMMCWVTDKQGHRIEQRGQVAQVMPQVGEAIHSALRRGDIYTRAEDDRFLILLMGINRENCSIVIQRIDECYTALRRGSRSPAVTLHYKMAPVGNMEPQQWKSGSVNWE